MKKKRKGASDGKPKGIFLICSWNGLTEDPKTQISSWKEDPFASSISDFLTALNWVDGLRTENRMRKSTINYPARVAEVEKQANLIVIVPRDRDKPLTVEELLVFHAGLGGSPKKVLYVHVSGHSPLTQGCHLNWLYRISRPDAVNSSLKLWLSSGQSTEKDALPLPIANFNQRYFEDRKIAINDDTWPSRTSRELIRNGLAGNSVVMYFYGMLRLSKLYNRLEHDLNAQLPTPFSDSDSLAKKRYLDQCYDLKTAMTASCIVMTQEENIVNNQKRGDIPQNVILLIDDHPERHGCQDDIAAVIEDFLPGYCLWIWNTEEARGEKGLLSQGHLENYSSLTKLSEELKIPIFEWPQVKLSTKKTIEEVLVRTRIALVDVLFQDASGADIESGYNLIRGFQRLCRDRNKDIEKYIFKVIDNSKDFTFAWKLPEIHAISRASDFVKANAAYRFGVGGYLLKERILGLPGVIAAGLHPIYDHISTAHRNFRLLYDLPHQTIGMLRSALVPQVSFHGHVTRYKGNVEEHSNIYSKTDRMASLLMALPKADIHVHPGSCMSSEFLVIASLVMLLRHDPTSGDPKKRNGYVQIQKALSLISNIANNKQPLELPANLSLAGRETRRQIHVKEFPQDIFKIAEETRDYLRKMIDTGEKNRKALEKDFRSTKDATKEEKYLRFRSILHKELDIPDHHEASKMLNALERMPDSKLFFFALRHGRIGDDVIEVEKDDLLRCVILVLAASDCYSTEIYFGDISLYVKQLFNKSFSEAQWNNLRNLFFKNEGAPHDFVPKYSVQAFRDNNWRLKTKSKLLLNVNMKKQYNEQGIISHCPEPVQDPLAWLLASGTRSTNLREYLDGCQYSGSEHLRHPILVHLFAQQSVHEFVRHGVLYAEMRVALSGYENPDLGISFSDACTCFSSAMGQAEEMVLSCYGNHMDPKCWLWSGSFNLKKLFNPLEDTLASYRFPIKTSIVLTGKRDKASRVLVREAGAGAVLHARPATPESTARNYVENTFGKCRVVGFDLAGQEEENPPHTFRTEYEQIARMHIPVTVHAGENAPSGFVESAILDLRARRLGHGLALAEDKLLMDRSRDDGVCVELCPVSNFQTNAVYPHGDAGYGREYPLRTFMSKGIDVCINTDNPIISYTNMVKECFQASYAYGKPGLTLWELLLILRVGFRQSFLTQPERRVLLELADQINFDLFSRNEIIELLQMLSFQRIDL